MRGGCNTEKKRNVISGQTHKATYIYFSSGFFEGLYCLYLRLLPHGVLGSHITSCPTYIWGVGGSNLCQQGIERQHGGVQGGTSSPG